MQVILANPRGFCAGVERAIAIVECAIEKFGAPIYVRHEVVHNKYVCDGLRAKGAVFVDELAEVPEGATVVFSAHGVAKSVRAEAERRNLHVFDATCPLVTKVHNQVARMRKDGREVVMIGHRGHPEVVGTMGQCSDGIHLVENLSDVHVLELAQPDRTSFVTQTTLSLDDAKEVIRALKNRFNRIAGPKKDDVCYATQNRQDAVRFLSKCCDVLIVVGSPESSNSNRLREIGEKLGMRSYMIERSDQIDPSWFSGAKAIGVTAGASAPEILVRQVVGKLNSIGVTDVEVVESAGVVEQISFRLPLGLV